jgi:hypothetical protein
MVRATKNATSSQPKSLPGHAAAIKGQGGFSLGLCQVYRAGSTMACTLLMWYPRAGKPEIRRLARYFRIDPGVFVEAPAE